MAKQEPCKCPKQGTKKAPILGGKRHGLKLQPCANAENGRFQIFILGRTILLNTLVFFSLQLRNQGFVYPLKNVWKTYYLHTFFLTLCKYSHQTRITDDYKLLHTNWPKFRITAAKIYNYWIQILSSLIDQSYVDHYREVITKMLQTRDFKSIIYFIICIHGSKHLTSLSFVVYLVLL